MVDILTNNKVLECLDVVSKTLGLEKEAILGTTRDRVLVDARRIIMNIVLLKMIFLMYSIYIQIHLATIYI